MRGRLLSLFLIPLIFLTAGCAQKSGLPVSNDTEQANFETDMDRGETTESTTAVPDIDNTVTEGATSGETAYPEVEESKPIETENTKPQTEVPIPETTKPEAKPTDPVQTDPPKATEPPQPVDTDPVQATQPEETEPPIPTQPPETTEPETVSFTEADHNRIVSEVMAYAESYAAKGFAFQWKESMTFGWDVGYMGTPRIDRDGIDGVIDLLKYHVDLIYKTSTDPSYGVTTTVMTYKVEQITVDGDLAYVVIYGG